eukprot:gene8470-biopygen6125
MGARSLRQSHSMTPLGGGTSQRPGSGLPPPPSPQMFQGRGNKQQGGSSTAVFGGGIQAPKDPGGPGGPGHRRAPASRAAAAPAARTADLCPSNGPGPRWVQLVSIPSQQIPLYICTFPLKYDFGVRGSAAGRGRRSPPARRTA